MIHEIDQAQLQEAKVNPPYDQAAGESSLVTPVLLGKIPQAHTSDINCVQFCPTDSNKLASVCDDGTLKLWQITSAAQEGMADQPMETN